MPDYSVTMPQEDWMRVLAVLADRPFKEVAPIINQMQRQLMEQQRNNKEEQPND